MMGKTPVQALQKVLFPLPSTELSASKHHFCHGWDESARLSVFLGMAQPGSARDWAHNSAV